MNYADIKDVDIQDGQGIRTSLYVSGCHFHCKECHNKEAWDFNYGKKFDEEAKQRLFTNLSHNYVEGLSLLGGEPLEKVNQQGLLPFIREVKEKFPDKTIWCWTGYDFEKDILNDMYKKYDYTKELMSYIDIIVDGQFEIDKKIVDLKFRGSYNQRQIDVKESLKQGKLVRLQFGDEYRYEDILEDTKASLEEKEEVTKEVEKSKIYKEISAKEENTDNKEFTEEKISYPNGKIVAFVPTNLVETDEDLFEEQMVISEIAAEEIDTNKIPRKTDTIKDK
jgi:anaerobic ribonucleoside-triphosphate reductase activating protein